MAINLSHLLGVITLLFIHSLLMANRMTALNRGGGEGGQGGFSPCENNYGGLSPS